MKKKEPVARKHPESAVFIQCPACGNDEFERSLSEKGAIVRLTDSTSRHGLLEKVIREGIVEFTYRCTKCKSVLIDTPNHPRNDGTRTN